MKKLLLVASIAMIFMTELRSQDLAFSSLAANYNRTGYYGGVKKIELISISHRFGKKLSASQNSSQHYWGDYGNPQRTAGIVLLTLGLSCGAGTTAFWYYNQCNRYLVPYTIAGVSVSFTLTLTGAILLGTSRYASYGYSDGGYYGGGTYQRTIIISE